MRLLNLLNHSLRVVYIASIFTGVALQAQSQFAVDSLKFHSIEVVTLSKSIHHNPKSRNLTPHDGDRLNHDAGQFLTQLSEINAVKKAGQYGMDPVLRGFKYEQLNVVIDGGLSAINACASRMDPPISQVNMNMIKEAQIYKGPYNFRFGPALGGSINFVTVEPAFLLTPTLSGQFSTGFESNGSVFKSEGSVALQSRKLVTNLFAGYQTADSYKDGNSVEVPSGFTRYNIGSKSSIRWNPHQQTTIQLTTNQARDVEFAALSMDLLYDKTWMTQLEHKSHFEKTLLRSLDFSGYASWVDHAMGTYDLSMISKVNSQTFGARGEALFQNASSKFFTGLDFKSQNAANSENAMPMSMSSHSMARDGTSWQDSSVEQIGWFNEFQTQWGHSKLSLSYRLDLDKGEAKELSELFKTLYNDGKSENINHSFSAGFTQIVSPKISLALWSGRAQRSPSISERYINRFPQGLDNYEMLGNPNLKPETNFQTDLIFSYQDKKLTFQATGFYAYLSDYISGKINPELPKSSMGSPGVRQYINLKQAFKAGFEFAGTYQISPHLHSTLGAAYTYAKDLKTKVPLPEIAPLELRTSLSAMLHPLELSAKLRFAASQNRIDPSFSELATPSFFLVDFDAKYHLFKSTVVFANVSNLFNQDYAEHLSRTLSSSTSQRLLSPGRNFGIGITKSF